MNKFSFKVLQKIGWYLITYFIVGIGVLGNAMAAESDEKYLPQIDSRMADLPTQASGETLVYFFPSDSDGTATVINILNSDYVSHIVPIRGYSSSGALIFSTDINLPATSMRRLVSDSVVGSPPASWAEAILVNFTDATIFASISLPKGVRVDGYIIFNSGTGVVDPRVDQGAIPLRFMINSKPAVVPIFLQ